MLNLIIKDKSLSLRQVSESDGELLFQIFVSTRENEIKMLSFWAETQRNAFFHQQFMAQHTYYKQTYLKADFWIIEQNNIPIGRLYFDTQLRDYFSIIDISILPNYRGKGIGEGILRDILSLAEVNKKEVRIHVENTNSAKRLYDKIGFRTIEVGDIYSEMKWKAHKS